MVLLRLQALTRTLLVTAGLARLASPRSPTSKTWSECPPEAPGPTGVGSALGLRLLENGTVSTKSQCGRPHGALGSRSDVQTQFQSGDRSPSVAGHRASCRDGPVAPIGGSLIEGRLRPRVVVVEILTESLILAQDERWRRASYMQVERGPSGLPEKT